MKTKTALIYLTILLLLGGYFYYFEVVRKEAQVKEKEAARRLFQAVKTEISALKIEKADNRIISLKKNGHWLIVEPLNTRADKFAVEGLLASVQSVEMERQLEETVTDLKFYGLDKPALHLSFQVADTWHHLRIGNKAPIGEKFYASGDQENKVVLISASQQRSLDKTLFDLRNKELFSLKGDDVDRIEIGRPNDTLVLARVDQETWQAPAVPTLKLKKSKVERVLDRLIWLRADRFLEDDKPDPAELGLDPPRIQVRLFSSGKKETILLGNTEKDLGLYAKSEEDPAIAVVSESLIEELPDHLTDLEDRSLLVFELDQIRSITWELEGKNTRLERHGEKWEWADGNGQKDPEAWRVNSLLWKLQELEYESVDQSKEASPPETVKMSLVVRSEDEATIGTYRLGEIPPEDSDRGVLWFSKGGAPHRPYWISGESLRGLHDNAKKLLVPES